MLEIGDLTYVTHIAPIAVPVLALVLAFTTTNKSYPPNIKAA